jgi:hAT family C-terminal dimerisation region
VVEYCLIFQFIRYLTRFGHADDEANAEDEDSDDELALHGIINPVALSPVKSSGSEVEQYQSEPLLKKSDKKTYAEFWQGASTFYPILGRMARDYGTILASSVPSKAVFSIAGLQITKQCNRLAPKTMGVIMCLQSWGLIEDGKDDDFDEDTDDNDVRKDRGFGRTEIDEYKLIHRSV